MYQHLQDARKKHKNDDALRIEKHRTTLFKNRFNFEQKKNKELRQLIDNGQNITQDEEEEYQDDDENTLILNDLVDHSDQNCKKPYSNEMMNLSSKIYSISPPAYSLLTEKLSFPSERQNYKENKAS